MLLLAKMDFHNSMEYVLTVKQEEPIWVLELTQEVNQIVKHAQHQDLF
jgi:molybdopterin synthase catalytic subunit